MIKCTCQKISELIERNEFLDRKIEEDMIKINKGTASGDEIDQWLESVDLYNQNATKLNKLRKLVR